MGPATSVVTPPAAPVAPRVDDPRVKAASPRISADWLAWPTLTELPTGPRAVGATFHKPELAVVMDFWGQLFMAELVMGPRSEVAGAVLLVVGGIAVGNLPHRIAEDYRQAVYELQRTGKRALCRISATPGPVAPDLLVHGAPRPRRLGDPFLPPTGGGEYVVLEVDDTALLDASLGTDSKEITVKDDHVVTTTTLVPRTGRLDVDLGGRQVGHLPGRYPLVEKAANFGYPLTCRSVLRRLPNRKLALQAFVPR